MTNFDSLNVDLLYHFLHSLSQATSSTSTTAGEQQLESLESFLDSISNSRPSSSVGLHPAAAEFGHCTIKGPLYRKERVRWTKCHCLIRNSFFECHKSSNISSSSKPLIKLFLPGTKISLVQVNQQCTVCVHVCMYA